MQSLKDIRENEIKIDMGITPIEVSLLNNQDLNRNYSSPPQRKF
jgi:hypothetical protein